MPKRCQFTVGEVLRQVLANSDSEEEDMQLSSEAETDVSSDGESARHSPQSAHGIADASPQRGRGGSILRTPSRGHGRGGRRAHNTIWVNVAGMKTTAVVVAAG